MENFIELNDSELITDILHKAFITVAEEFNFTKENAPRFPAFISSDYIDEQFRKGMKLFGYSLNGRIIGCAGYMFYRDRIYEIVRLAVLPEYRHAGIGKKLMGFVENKIIENGGSIAEIHAVDKNLLVRKWYKSLGYIEIRIDELKSVPFNSVVMNKELNQVQPRTM